MKKILLFLFVLSSFLVKSQSQDTVLTGGGLYLYTDNTFTTILAIHQNIYITPPSAPICLGSSTTLTAQNSSTYTWNTGATTSTISVSPIVNTTYTVTGINNGYKSTSQAVVSVLPVTLTATSNSICLGSSGTLTASGGIAYTWNIGSNSSVIVIAPTTTTAYSVSGLDMNGCVATATATMTVNPLPTITVNSVTISSGSATLTASGGISYVWSNTSTSSSITISPTITTSYYVTGTNLAGCTGTARGVVTVNLPMPTAGLVMWLKADAGVKASGGYVYEWDDQSPIGTNNALQSTGAYQPKIGVNTLNGKPVITYDNRIQQLISNFALAQPMTIFIVKTVHSGSSGVLFGGNGTDANRLVIYYSRVLDPNELSIAIGAGAAVFECTKFTSNLTFIFNSSSSKIYENGSLLYSPSSLGSNGFPLFDVGYEYNNLHGAQSFTGDIAEVLIYNSALGTTDRTNVEQYLKTKYAL